MTIQIACLAVMALALMAALATVGHFIGERHDEGVKW